MVVGHKFELKTSRGSKHYCEKCNAVIWGMLQEWYRCSGNAVVFIDTNIAPDKVGY